MAPAPSTLREIDAHTVLVGLLGDPVRHSLSPAMHNAALAELGLNWVYLALPAPTDRLEVVLQGLEAVDCRGLNVTIPHKQAVAPLCSQLSPLAERLGAVNTLCRQASGGWLGTNTDVEGFLAPLHHGSSSSSPNPWADRQAVVLGCGGSARAVVAGLANLGLASIQLAGRRADALQAFQTSCANWAPQLQTLCWPEPGHASAGPLAKGYSEAFTEALSTASLIVNTTPVGMASAQARALNGPCPLRAEQLAHLSPEATVYDLIYTPRPTPLLQAAAARGCRTIDGLEMLVQQGAAALRLWSQQSDVPVDAMRRAAEAALATDPG